MIRGNAKKIAALSLSLAIAFGSTAFAASNTPEDQSTSTPKHTEASGFKGGPRADGFRKTFQELKISDQELKEARETGKNIFDLAKAKGYTPEQVRAMLIKNSTESINKAVADGKLSKEEADTAIKRNSEKITAWDGTLQTWHGHRRGGFLNSNVLAQLGVTKADLTKAREGNKTLFDLAKEKKGLTPEQVKAIILKSKTEEINKKVSDGKIPKEKGQDIISKMKTRLDAWDGSLKKDDNSKLKH